jgi:hypothetical protein
MERANGHFTVWWGRYVAIHINSPLPSYCSFGQLRWVICASMFAGRNVILTIYPTERKFIW